ncbi:hypothetical protein Tco_1239818 [Tanacetum coccineum]
MEVPDAIISDAIRKKEGYTYYMAKKMESKKAKIIDEPEEQHVSPVESRRGKGFLCYNDQVANVTDKLKKDVVPGKTRSLTIAEETVVDMYNEWGQKLKGLAVDDPAVQLFLDKPEESANKTNDANESDMDLSDDNLHRDDDVAEYEVFMHNKSTAIPNSTYLSSMVSSSLLDFIQTLLHETAANELMDFMSHPVYIDAQTTLVVHNPEGKPKLTSYISGASEVPLGTHVEVLATKNLMQEMFLDENAHHLSSPPAIKKSNPKNPQPNSLQAKAKKEYDQKLEALTNFNISEAFEKAVQAKVLTEIKKLLPTHISNVVANYVRPRLNTFVLKVMKTNQINLFTQSSTSTNDLSEMDLKIKLPNQIYSNKSNEIHTTHHQLYDTLYESITLDQDALDAQAAQSSFHKRSHDNLDPPNNREGENKKKQRKDVGEPSSRSSRQNRSPIVIVQDGTPSMQPLDKTYILIQKHSNPKWFLKKSGLAKRRTTWFDLFLKSDIDKDENHILGPSTIAIAKKFKELIQKDELTIADLEGAGLERLRCSTTMMWNSNTMFVNSKQQYYQKLGGIMIKEIIEEKYTTSITKHYAARYYKEGIEDMILKEVCHYHFEALNVRRSDDKEYEFSYAYLPRLSVNDVEDIRTMIQNRVEDIQLRVESYRRTLNLTKPTMFFEGINQRIPFTMTATHKRAVYLNQYNIKSLMKLSEVKKFCDGTLVKIQENLIDMLSKNKLGSGNKKLKGRDWTDYDVKSS